VKVLVFSDTHLGHPGWGTFGYDVFDAANRIARSDSIDVVLFCGDLVEPSNQAMTLDDGLRKLAAIPAKHHLWVAGNNDIEFLPRKSIMQYHQPLAFKAQAYGVQLLDAGYVVIDNVGFAGNFGFYDLSLWRNPKVIVSEYPVNYPDLYRTVSEFHKDEMGFDFMDLFKQCQMTLWRHIQTLVSRNLKIVVATHMVPGPEFLLYGESPAYDYQNAWMGWDDSKSASPIANTPGLVYQFCGHTHRSKTVKRLNSTLMNVSGQDQPYLFEV